ncbi:bifunctional 4-hydroxy-2-oxoglutarate aldolase/2-dehydro-3-deoxy-phosphogluconate aldolase [Agaribacterium haliotis]|uniref:bifunctional 4-hydroxy-2-oxoglutarate aldolase/2-dehydro-3-deoxy-phosphogluconate aldolase n=1 Tax=Agaribacterium haliotis TaxID=2013869 RepID=UPI000BB59661|nr:bifunctional 4-hydroxy-2-oxoglutarate aldolase/2-dehydro-3-deoxy-phosphogluconate aldolase [Agaribacterium haliotis]
MMTKSDYEAVGVMPVMVIEKLEHAVPLARALQAGGIKALEITLRSDVAWQAIETIKKEVEDIAVGVGTISNAEQLERAAKLELDFAISPGLTANLLAASKDLDIAFLPGVATPSELIMGMEGGLECFKFFPAEAAGGIPMLKSFAGPYPQISFCPTGGISMKNVKDYLALPNVMCVGGSWLAEKQHVQAENWAAITDCAKETLAHIG